MRHGEVLALTAWNFPYVSDALGQAWDYGVFQSDARAILEEELARVGNHGVKITGAWCKAIPPRRSWKPPGKPSWLPWAHAATADSPA